MGGKQSKNKHSRDRDDLMNDPTYILQGELDSDIDELSTEEVWVRREDSDVTCTTFDDDAGKCKTDTVQIIYRETVLSGTKEETFQPDHYDIIDDSCLEDETELKLLVNDRSNNAQPRLYHELPTPSTNDKPLKRRPDYENMVMIFKPLLVENIIVRRLLPHIPFLSNPDRIRAIEERDPRAAVIYLIDELCTNSSREPGRWKQFIQALEMCGYNYIVDTLRGHDHVDHTYQREYLKIITPILRELINPTEILPILWGVDVISNEDNEEIGRIERNLGTIAAATKLLDLVPRRHKYWYPHLVDALRVANKHEAADMLAIPEILNFDGVEKDEYKKYNSERFRDKESNTSHVKKSTQIRYHNERDSASTDQKTSGIYVPDNCEYLDCENDSDPDSYFSMNELSYCNTRNKPYLQNKKRAAIQNQPYDQEEESYILYEEQSLIANASSSEMSLTESYSLRSETLGDKRLDLCQPDKDNSYKYSNTVEEKDGDRKVENEAECQMDVYKYEPPMPSSIAPEMPGQNENKDKDSPQSEMDSAAESTESDDVEVIPLSVSARKHRRYYSYTSKDTRTPKPRMQTPVTGTEEVLKSLAQRNSINSNGKANYKRTPKPPMPTPLTGTEDVPPSLSKIHCSFSHGKGTVINKPPRAAPRRQIVSCKNALTHKDKNDEERAGPNTSQNEEECIKSDDGGSIYVISDEEGIKPEKATRQFRKHLTNVLESTKRDKQRKTEKRRLCHTKVVGSILKKKIKRKNAQHSKLNSRRKPLVLLTSRLQESKCFNFERGVALINRDRMPTPKAVKKQNVDTGDSKILQDHDNTNDLKHVLGSNKEDTNTQLPAYSEPFRSHRGKEDEDIFTTVRQVRYDRWSENCKKGVTTSRLLQTARFNSIVRKRSDTDELLNILKSCYKEFDSEDYILESKIETKTVTKDNLSAELRKGLENVRDQEKKLNNLVHGEKILKKKVRLQVDINEVLKQHRTLSNTLIIKEKEAKALEAAITGGTQDLREDIYSPSDSEEFYTRAEIQRRGQCPHFCTNSASNNEDIRTAEITSYRDNNVAEVEEVNDKIRAVEKDSAFYSSYSTKL